MSSATIGGLTHVQYFQKHNTWHRVEQVFEAPEQCTLIVASQKTAIAIEYQMALIQSLEGRHKEHTLVLGLRDHSLIQEGIDMVLTSKTVEEVLSKFRLYHPYNEELQDIGENGYICVRNTVELMLRGNALYCRFVNLHRVLLRPEDAQYIRDTYGVRPVPECDTVNYAVINDQQYLSVSQYGSNWVTPRVVTCGTEDHKMYPMKMFNGYAGKLPSQAAIVAKTKGVTYPRQRPFSE